MLFRRITLTARRPSSNALCGFFPWRALFFVFFSETQVSFPLGTEEGAPQIGGLSVTDLQKDQITTMRGQGYGYATIAKSVGLKKDAVVAFCRKAGLTGTKATDNSRISLSAEFCPQCGVPLKQTPGRKRIRFCTDSCRVAWWNAHPEAVRRKAVYSFACACCGRAFTAYGNAGRKYCSHACYISARFKGGASHE